MEKCLRCFKFRGIRNDCRSQREMDISRIVDIVKNRRLFCSDWRNQNDILEGTYLYNVHEEWLHAHIDENGNWLQSQKEMYRICSLSKRINNSLMWAHYASSHTGVAIELKLRQDSLFPVTYNPKLPRVNLEFLDADGDRSEIVKKLLLNKTACWKYESEVRLLVEGRNFYELDGCESVVKVYCGARMNRETFEELQERLVDIRIESISAKYPDKFGRRFDFVSRNYVR